MQKQSVDAGELLKWILGAAAAGAGARAAFGVGSSLFPSAQKDVQKSLKGMSQEAVTVPVDVTPEQYEEYQRRRRALGLTSKKAGWADPAIYTLGGVGGLGLGWMVASQIARKIRNARLDQEMDRVRKELSTLSGTVPQVSEEPDEEELKTAAVYDWLDMTAERAVSEMEKTAAPGFSRLLRSAASAAKRGITLPGVLGSAALAAPLAAGGYMTRKMVSTPGGGSGVIPGTAKFIGEPVFKILGATLGPIAALVGLHGLIKGYSKARSSSVEQARLKALRRQIYRQERARTPRVKFVPRVKEREQEREERSRDPNRLGLDDSRLDLNEGYGKAAVDRAVAKYSQVTGLGMNGMFGGPPVSPPAPPAGPSAPAAGGQTSDSAILPRVQDEESIPPPSPELRQQATMTPAGQKIQANKAEEAMKDMAMGPMGEPPVGAAPGMPMMG